ncbi:MAG: GGDEF domain-containing protein [Candidatus Obscuribacterales bacterium]
MVQDQEPLFAREGLFRQKLNQLRKTGSIIQNAKVDSQSRLRELEQGGYLTNVQSTLKNTDPKEMERLTLLDNVTELYNHNTVTRILSDELKRSKRYKHDCTIVMILVDGLYQAQQGYGSDVSDSILKGVSDFLMAEVRDVDIPSRFSSEQLLVVCPETNTEGTCVLGERLRNKICLERVSDLGQNWHVTLSIGIASFPEHASNFEDLINAAETALNRAVDHGGNVVYVAS